MIIYPSIEKLLYYAQAHLLLDDLDVIYARNLILDELKLSDYVQYEIDTDAIDEMQNPDAVLEPLVTYAVENGIITEDQRDYFSDKLMNIVIYKPSEVVDMFEDLHAKSPAKAFDWLYDYSIKSDYIKQTRIARNKHWEAKGTKGKLEITINLSKPERSNKATAKMLNDKAKAYPECMICKENEGFSNGSTHCRKTLRTVPMTLGGEEWFWQFSPYSYFNQHGIAVNSDHTPMKVDRSTLDKLLDFVDYMPNYFIGCNAALPIIGGSILTHDHFQGGLKQLPMQKAPALKKIKSEKFPYIDMCVVDWYNSVIRMSYTNKQNLAECAESVINAWANYSDDSVDIIAKTDARHNSVTPIARRLPDGKYCLDIILRNNRTSDEFPEGIFHSHPEYFPIKSEAIGLIEAMGLFILPGRLDAQLAEIEKFLTKEVKYNAAKLDENLLPLKPFIEKLVKESGTAKLSQVEAQLNIKDEINRVCEGILDNTAVFKKDEKGVAAFDRFLASMDIR